MWHGDWAKGPAGGYGTKATDWGGQYDVWDNDAGIVAESVKWTTDFTNNTGTIVYTIRQGIHFALDPTSAASRLVNGRQLTANDVAVFLKRMVTEPTAYIWKSNLPLRAANITQTGSWEVTVKLPLDALMTGIFRFSDCCYISPAELSTADWHRRENVVGSGPYIFTDYVPGSTMTMVRNPNYWQKNPVGPGKGDQLPYIDKVINIIVPDSSTRQAALRVGKFDQAGGYAWEDASAMRKQVPVLKEAPSGEATKPANSPESIDVPCDAAPYNDVRVRRALMMATDFESINNSLYNGQGQILMWPFTKTPGYEDLYVDFPDMPALTRELYTYNPEKAKALLKEAGFPSGFKAKAIMISQYVDFWSIIKDEWSKVGVDLSFDVRESVARMNFLNAGTWGDEITDGGMASVSAFHSCPTITGTPSANANTSRIFDPKVDQALADIRHTILKDGMKAGMKQSKELVLYMLDLAYAIPVPYVFTTTFWWPWLKNYTGELTLGYYDMPNWVPFVWIDQDLKKSMGH